MKKAAAVFVLIAVMLMSAAVVNADIGIPAEPLYDVVTDIGGIDCYKAYEDAENDTPTGEVDGGLAFHVFSEGSPEGYYWGSADPAAGPNNTDSFVYIKQIDTVSKDENIPPEVGEDTGEETEATTTDDLNMRTGPGTGFKVVEVLKKNTSLTYRYIFRNDSAGNDNSEWAYVSLNGKAGWVSVKYLKEKSKKEVKKEDSESAETADAPEASAEESEQSAVSGEAAPASDRKILVVGIICICIGAALLIAAVAYFLIKNRRD